MKCSNLTKNRPVVCLVPDFSQTKKIPMDGSVIYVTPENRTVCVGYMEGYRYVTQDIPYEDMLAAFDEKGEHMRFENIHGPSVLLTAE